MSYTPPGKRSGGTFAWNEDWLAAIVGSAAAVNLAVGSGLSVLLFHDFTG
ncbi:hypothetical protein AB0L63_05520 [Nocardia sp. NPDC051990]